MFVRMERIINTFFIDTLKKKVATKVVFLPLQTFKINHPAEDEQWKSYLEGSRVT